MSHTLNPILFPLRGSHLIEASAGTGKTWTIAALYVRLVLGHGGRAAGFIRPLMPNEILVMTFTRAATRELSDRVRARLLEAARCFRDPSAVPDNDDFLQPLLQDYADDAQRNHAAWLLSMAADGMDDAAIFTIDAWCQRMLREHAFESGNLFEEELVADEQLLLQQAAQDYWRQECYPLQGAALDMVLNTWSSPTDLQRDVADLLRHGIELHTPYATLAAAMDSWQPQVAALLQGKDEHIDTMRQWLAQQLSENRTCWNKISLKDATVADWTELLLAWKEQAMPTSLPHLEKGLTRLTPSGLLDARTKVGLAKITINDIPSAFTWFEALTQGWPQEPLSVRLRLHATVRVGQRLEQLKRQRAQFGFTDMLQRLHAALTGENAAALRQRIQNQYPVALIDEFQDTSPLQYRLFDEIYGVAAHPSQLALLLIGDPKQSIYGFRGADIYSYLQARQATQGRHHVLGTNYRSTPALVTAVNRCFEQAEQQHASGAFLFRQPGLGENPVPFLPVQAKQARTRWTCSQPLAPMQVMCDLQLQSAEKSRQHFAALCAEQVVTWLNDAQAGFWQIQDGVETEFKRLRPSDMAILVRTGKEAHAVQAALRRRQVPSVYLSNLESVFQSQEAQDLVLWLQAVATPQDATLVRAAFATQTMDLSLNELEHMASDDEAFDTRSQQLQPLKKVWQSQGVLCMLRQSLHQLGLAARWLQDENTLGERRLTNYLHLAELLQDASSHLDGEQALIRWLQLKRSEAVDSSDDQVVRLESDADLIQIVTIHKSKGLEYPIVLLPFATGYREFTASGKGAARSVSLRQANGEARLALSLTNEVVLQADLERLREDLRLLYVALTRAKQQLWVGFSTLKYGRSDKCRTHKSAAGYLLSGGVSDPDWRELWQKLAHLPEIGVQEVVSDANTVPMTRLNRADGHGPLQAAKTCTGTFDRRWGVDSYSRLTRVLRQPNRSVSAPVLLGERYQREDDEAGAGALPGKRSPQLVAEVPIWFRFKRGPQAGDFLHGLLERAAMSHFADLTQGDAQAQREQLLERCQGAGYGEQADDVLSWLQAMTQTPLPALGVSLSGVGWTSAEMEFWLPVKSLHPQAMDAFCQRWVFPGVERPTLQGGQVHGMLMGFMDLVFEHEGRYWVMDYKSTDLGHDNSHYSPQALQRALMPHRYDVQAIIYVLALHRLLQQRLGEDYDPEQHLGGALFFFVRGIGEDSGRGVCHIALPADSLAEFDGLLSGVPLED